MSKEMQLTSAEVEHLLSPEAIRERAAEIFDLTCKGQTGFVYHEDRFKPTLDYVLQVIRKNYPDLDIPFHSRWGHFRAGGFDRVKALDNKISGLDPLERARIKLDLVIPSVLLDAGAGMSWRFEEAASGKAYGRSEGLGVASIHMFMRGEWSHDRKSLRTDIKGLKALEPEALESGFQVGPTNPLVGIEGRLLLLKNLATALENKAIFKDGRPGNVIDYLMEKHGRTIPARAVLGAVLEGLGPIWPGRLTANGINLGDVWQYSKLGSGSQSLVPFHKLSQWMTYSLIEPMIEAGLSITNMTELTGLAEYRNGGLLLDSGLVTLGNPADADRAWAPESDLVIEWRALTIHLLDRIGDEARQALGKTPEEFPLAKVLEGGTWWAGRFLAQEKRDDGGPPLKIQSDGTVF